MTILALGSHDDPLIQAVIHCGTQTVVVGAELRGVAGIDLELDGNVARGGLTIGRRLLPLDELDGVLVRMSPGVTGGIGMGDDEQQYVNAELMAALYGLLRAMPCPVVNRPQPGVFFGPSFARSGLACSVRECGFALAPVVLASTGEAARAFFDACGARVVLGAPRLARSIQLEGEEGWRRLLEQGSRPCYLQAVPAGSWLRIFVAGGCCIASDPEPEPPPRLADRCLRLGAKLGLGLFEIHALCGEDGVDYCFSVNDLPDLSTWSGAVLNSAAQTLVDLFTRQTRRAAA